MTNFPRNDFTFVDNKSFLEIYFDVTACDAKTYLCKIYDTNTSEGNDTASLAVRNCMCHHSPGIRAPLK